MKKGGELLYPARYEKKIKVVSILKSVLALLMVTVYAIDMFRMCGLCKLFLNKI
jgi:hypothetical protein